jgi:hypothetical protein
MRYTATQRNSSKSYSNKTYNGPLGIPIRLYNRPAATGRQNTILHAITELSNESKSSKKSSKASKSSRKSNNSDVITLRRSRTVDRIRPGSTTRRLFPRGYNPIKGVQNLSRKLYNKIIGNSSI